MNKDEPVNIMSGTRNKTAGHNFERDIVNVLKTVGFEHASTSRLESRARDNQKVDIMNKNEHKVGRLEYNIQCKNLTVAGKFPYAQLLSEMPAGPEINVIFHNETVKRVGKTGNARFITKGQYAHLGLKDFVTMMSRLKAAETAYKILNDYFDCIPEEDKLAVTAKLEALGV